MIDNYTCIGQHLNYTHLPNLDKSVEVLIGSSWYLNYKEENYKYIRIIYIWCNNFCLAINNHLGNLINHIHNLFCF